MPLASGRRRQADFAQADVFKFGLQRCRFGSTGNRGVAMLSARIRNVVLGLMLTMIGIGQPGTGNSAESAKQVFGSQALPAALKPQSHGFYSKGCLAGATAMPWDGPTWQVMRPSRNRRWGHPALIETLEELSIKAKRDGWNGLLIGDLSQPRGGPMLTGHTSHQIGLDADIWFRPMPDKRLDYSERENMSAISILKNGTPYVDDQRWNRSFERILYHAAAFEDVERILVHPGIKKKLCDTVKGDRGWLQKIRPYYGHHYHFHVRIGCQDGSPGCRSQNPTTPGTGCGKPLDWWFNVALKPKKPAPNQKPRKPKIITMDQLPNVCAAVASASEMPETRAVYKASSLFGFSVPALDLPERLDPMAALASKPIEAEPRKIVSPVYTDLSILVSELPLPKPAPSR